MPVHTLTRLSTNIYQYLQLRQRILYALLPLCTRMEIITFNIHILDQQFRKTGAVFAPHEDWKNVDHEKLSKFWNLLVNGQPRTETESNKRLYYKFPQQLEAHHKKTILWKSERSTLGGGLNHTSLQPFRALV
ncbi:hypothetical protein R3P38DRAFT_2450898, partial [Favolaschia claudopus]